MRVRATFADGFQHEAVWVTNGPNQGIANDPGFKFFFLSLAGPTGTADWSLRNMRTDVRLTSLFIDAGAGDTVFDRASPSPGSAGSELGIDFVDRGSPFGSIINVTYSQPVGVGGNPPLGDLYARMLVDLSGYVGGGLPFNTGFNFGQDTDNLSIKGDLEPAPIPLPAGLPLLATGLGALGFFSRRRFGGAKGG